MKERCRRQHINFWPVAIEADGAITSNFLRFFNNVCDAANSKQFDRSKPHCFQAPLVEKNSV
jgi:hypothetical protein